MLKPVAIEADKEHPSRMTPVRICVARRRGSLINVRKVVLWAIDYTNLRMLGSSPRPIARSSP
jgi:hypothetical protein